MNLIIITISWLGLAVLSRAEDEACQDAQDFRICSKSGRISSARRLEDFKSFELKLYNDTAIAANAFDDPSLRGLELQLIIIIKGSPPTRLYTLDLQQNSFAGLPSLTSLTIRYADVKTTTNFLTPLPALKQLRFLLCKYSEVPSELLTAVPNLESLSLQRNRIREIRPNAFAALKNLKELNLSFNRITNLQPGCFNGLEGLQKLDLSYSDLVDLSGLSGLSQLTTLHLSRAFVPERSQYSNTRSRFSADDFTALRPGMFAEVPRLRQLVLNKNAIRIVPKGVFNELKELEVLTLWKSNIGRIEPGAFAGLNLTRLDLSDSGEAEQPGRINEMENIYNKYNGGLIPSRNHISEIEPMTFDGLTVASLDLSDNDLTRVGAQDFFGLDVGVLDLSGNGVGTIAPLAFANSRVQVIKLNNNLQANVRKRDLGLPESTIVELI